MAIEYNYLYPDSSNIICLTKIQLEYLTQRAFCILGNNGAYAYKETLNNNKFIFVDPFTTHEITLKAGDVFSFGEYGLWVEIDGVNTNFQPIKADHQTYHYFPYGDPEITGKLYIDEHTANLSLMDLVEVVFENTPLLVATDKLWYYKSHNIEANEITFANYHKPTEEENLVVSVKDIFLIENRRLKLKNKKIDENSFFEVMLAGLFPMHLDCIRTRKDFEYVEDADMCGSGFTGD